MPAKKPAAKNAPKKPLAKSDVKKVAVPEAQDGFKLFNGKRLKKVCLAYSGGLDTSIMIDRKSTRLNSSH